MDKLLMTAAQPSPQFIKSEGLKYFTSGENSDYFAGQLLLVSKFSIENFQEATRESYRILMEAAKYVVSKRLWREAGIPQNAERLIEYSLKFRQNDHLLGRFDFAGGIGNDEIKLLEFNADSFSLLPETVKIQENILKASGSQYHTAFNRVHDMLVAHFRKILAANPEKHPNLLLAWMGFEEDLLNIKVVGEAAKAAGFRQIEYAELTDITFSEEEGIFLETGDEEFVKFDFFYKLAPWDILAHDEPELMEILTKIVLNGEAIVINPAHAMLLQSKGLLKIACELFPDHKLLLRTTDQSYHFSDNKYVEKPMWGRVGDNVRIFNGDRRPVQENDGDYGNFPKIYQKLAVLETDSEGNFYQPSIYCVAGEPAGLCARRQEDWIIDDDAEFIATARLV